MKTLKITFFSALLGIIPVSSNAAERKDSKSINPALIYWQAASMMPELGDGTAKKLRDIADGKVEFRSGDITDDFTEVMRLLKKAAVSEAPTEWGMDWEDGPYMTLPHLSKIRELSTVVLALAESKFATDEKAEGIELLLLGHKMARDSGTGDLLVSHLVQNVLEQRTIRLAAKHCLDWNEDECANYLKAFESLPAYNPLHRAYASEIVLVDWFEKELKKNPGALDEFIGGEPGMGPLKRLFMFGGKSVAELIKEYRDLHAEYTESLKLERVARRVAVGKFTAEIEETNNILVKVMFPAMTKIAVSEDKTLAAQAMLKQALENGSELDESHLKDHPFELKYSKTDEGYQLSFEDLKVRFGK